MAITIPEVDEQGILDLFEGNEEAKTALKLEIMIKPAFVRNFS